MRRAISIPRDPPPRAGYPIAAGEGAGPARWILDRNEVTKLLGMVKEGKLAPREAAEKLASLGTADLGYARIDHLRPLRRGFPEVVFGEGKTTDQVLGIVDHMARGHQPILVTRVSPETGEQLQRRHPQGNFNPIARTFFKAPSRRTLRSGLLIVSAGTADLPVAEEAAVSAEAFGLKPERLYDVGVAGLHRLLEKLETLRKAKVLIVVAGMEGALPSVVTGLVEAPVIGVPTSVGYGTALGGLTALFGMLSSCSGGLTVVNIDNGFGAACAARTILGSKAKP